jgi:hypothetical protein
MFIYVVAGESWKAAEAGEAGCAAVGTVVDAGVVLRLGAVVPAEWNTRRRLVRQQQGPQHTCNNTRSMYNYETIFTYFYHLKRK